MKNLEPVYNKINTLIIEELPSYIDKINKLNNDDIILESLHNIDIEKNVITIHALNLRQMMKPIL